MRAIIGWAIIGVSFGAASMVLLWPLYRLLRRSKPDSRRLLWAYAAATAVSSVVLWFLIPLAIHELFGRTPP